MDHDLVLRLLAASGLDSDRVGSCTELAGGTYNTAFRVRTVDGDGYVLKVAPDPRLPAMTYERELMRTEVQFYQRSHGAVPVPRLVHADLSRALLDRDFLVMTELPGTSWYSRRDAIDEADRARLRAELGRIVAGLHRLTGPGFGYPQLGLHRTWPEAFASMVAAVLADAARFAVPLPVPADRISGLLRTHAALFDDVVTPVLVHFDLWDGNILLTDAGVSGLVDGERAFWGDPLAELASLALFGDIAGDAPFLDAYRAAGGTVAADRGARFRLAAYRTLLYLVMLVETAPRGMIGPEHESRSVAVARHVVENVTAMAGIAAST